MPRSSPQSLTRLGVFIDGGFYHQVSHYYSDFHTRKGRLNLRGLLQYLAHVAAIEEDVEPARARVVETHYFRGRLPTDHVAGQDLLAEERKWDDVLTREGVITHYLPAVSRDGEERFVEKGVDVWLALEALELTRLKEFDVVVLLTGDRDFVPLLRKLHTLGARTLLPVWEIAYTDHLGAARYIRTSPWLIREASHVHRIMEAIDAAPIGRDPLVDSLFLGGRTGHARQAAREAATQAALAAMAPAQPAPAPAPPPRQADVVAARPPQPARPAPAPYAAVPRTVPVPDDGDLVLAKVTSLKNQFGFAKIPRLERDAFFHANFLEDATFSIALDGQWLEGYLQRREDGTVQLHEIRVLWDISEDALREWFEEDRSREEAKPAGIDDSLHGLAS